MVQSFTKMYSNIGSGLLGSDADVLVTFVCFFIKCAKFRIVAFSCNLLSISSEHIPKS